MIPQRKLPFPVNVINSLGGVMRRLNRNLPNLTVEHVHNTAMKKTGLSDFGDLYYLEGLNVLMKAAREDGLNFIGRVFIQNQAVLYATRRLEWVEMMKREPEAFATPLKPPLAVVGLHRSGTTILQRMLAADPAHQAIPLWRQRFPFPPLDGSPDKRRGAVIKQVKQIEQLQPDLNRFHVMTVDEPEECMMVHGMSFVSFVLYMLAPLPSYLDWFEEVDCLQTHEEYRAMLGWYQSADPRRLVLKSPSYTGELRELLTVIPDAMIVHTHRDPAETVSSMNSLYHTTHSGMMQPYNMKRMAERNLSFCSASVTRNMAVRDELKLNVCDILYDDLVADPLGTVQKIYTHFGLEWTDASEQSISQYMADNPRGKHGVHQYSAADFDMTAAQIREQFASYCERFSV